MIFSTMDLPNATATLTPRIPASDYVFFQRDLTDETGRRRSADQATGVFTRDYAGNYFQDGILYCFCASSPTVGDDALMGFFNAAGQAIAYTGQQPINSPANLSAAEQQLIAPAGISLPTRRRYGRGIMIRPRLGDFSADFASDFD